MFSLQRRASPVLKHNRVSEVFKGFKVHDFEYYGQRNYVLKWKFNLYVIRNVSFTFGVKKIIRKRAQICDRCTIDNLPCSANFTRVDGPTMLEV